MPIEFPSPSSRVLPANIRCEGPPRSEPSPSLDRVVGSLVGLALGDAFGASVEFRPHSYLVANPVLEMQGGGTWALQAGQWTDDTSMALCLASSLLTEGAFNPYDQMVRYKWWFQQGYLSSTGQCFDIGATTRATLEDFSRRQRRLKDHFRTKTDEEIDRLPYEQLKNLPGFDVFCGMPEKAGNGPLMRLAPVPLFFFRDPPLAVHLAGESARLTHGDRRASDACRYYAALIVAALHGQSKEEILSGSFYENHQHWFGAERLDREILDVARGSFKKPQGYEAGIRGKNFIVNTLEAALWAFCYDQNSFVEGARLAVNLGDDTDTTAAVYGQLAGAFYGLTQLPPKWLDQLYARRLITCVAQWLHYQGSQIKSSEQPPAAVKRITPRATQDRVGYSSSQAPPTAAASAPKSSIQYVLGKHGKVDPSPLPPAGVPSGKR